MQVEKSILELILSDRIFEYFGDCRQLNGEVNLKKSGITALNIYSFTIEKG